MNPFTILKYKSQLEGNHPRAAEFVKKVILTGLPEGTVVEVSITKPGEETKTSNIRVTREDIELFDEVRKNKEKYILFLNGERLSLSPFLLKLKENYDIISLLLDSYIN